MTHRSSSPTLIKGVDGIVSRSSNKVSYSALDGKRVKQPENEIRQIYRKFGISGNIEKYVKQEKMPANTKI